MIALTDDNTGRTVWLNPDYIERIDTGTFRGSYIWVSAYEDRNVPVQESPEEIIKLIKGERA